VTIDERPQRPWVGTLLSADADSVRLTSSKNGQTVAVPTISVVRLERSRDRRSNAGRGALIGGLAGAGAALLLGIIASSGDDSGYEIGSDEFAAGTALFSATCAALGSLIGAASHRERWESIPLPSRTKSEAVTPRRVRLELSARF
jgi:hypothetical protein